MEPRSHDAIQRDLEQAMMLRDILKDTLLNHRCKPFLKYHGRGDNSFAQVNATALINGTKAKYLDTILSESGYADFDELDASVEEYLAAKEQLRSAQTRLNGLRKERGEAAAYHRAIGWGGTRESIVGEIKEKALKKPSLAKPFGGLEVARIKRFKPRTRAFMNKHAARRRLEDQACDNLDDRGYRNQHDRFLRRAYRNIFKRNLRAGPRRKGFLDRIIPNVGTARSIDRFVEEQAPEAPAATATAAPGEKGEKAE